MDPKRGRGDYFKIENCFEGTSTNTLSTNIAPKSNPWQELERNLDVKSAKKNALPSPPFRWFVLPCGEPTSSTWSVMLLACSDFETLLLMGSGKNQEPGDSSRDLFIPKRWRSLKNWKGHVNSPSQKGHENAELPGRDCSATHNGWDWDIRPSNKSIFRWKGIGSNFRVLFRNQHMHTWPIPSLGLVYLLRVTQKINHR